MQRNPQVLLVSIGKCGARAVDEQEIRFHRFVGARWGGPETGTTIQTTTAARDRPRKPAAERGLTTGELIGELADATLTVQELKERAQRIKSDLETTLRVTVTAEDAAAGRAPWPRIAEHQGGGRQGTAA